MDQPPPSASGTVVIVAAGLVAGSLVVFFLAALLGPMLIALGGMALAVIAFGGLHYWLWGRLMPPTERDDAAE